MKKTKSPWKLFRIALLLFAVALFLFLIMRVYAAEPSDPFTRKVAQSLDLPIAFASSKMITFNQYYARADLAEKINHSALDQEASNALIDQLINDALVQKLLAQKNISISEEELDNYYQFLKKITFTDNFDFEALDISDQDFKEQIVRPELARTKLEVALASDQAENGEVYKQAQDFLDLLQKGAKFSDLAEEHSQDPQSAEIGGGMGFVGYNDVVPEIYAALRAIKDHDPHLIASRFGLHLVVVAGQDEKGLEKSVRYNFKQIFLKTEDFEQWFAKQKNNFRIVKLK